MISAGGNLLSELAMAIRRTMYVTMKSVTTTTATTAVSLPESFHYIAM
jgi:hypothetical protein